MKKDGMERVRAAYAADLAKRDQLHVEAQKKGEGVNPMQHFQSPAELRAQYAPERKADTPHRGSGRDRSRGR